MALARMIGIVIKSGVRNMSIPHLLKQHGNPYTLTASGIKFHILDPAPEEIRIEDIAQGLAFQNRFCGHRGHRSIAAHSMMVSDLVPPEFALHALLHDSSEAYMADIPGPFKVFFPDYREIEYFLMRAIYRRFGVDPTPGAEAVKEADRQCLAMEMGGRYWRKNQSEQEKWMFLDRFKDLHREPEPREPVDLEKGVLDELSIV